MSLHPIIKWAGGKTKILEEFTELYQIAKCERFIDLFCGSLSLPLSLKPSKAVFNDINDALINMYEIIKNDLPLLIEKLIFLNDGAYNTKEEFNRLRSEYNAYKKMENYTLEQRVHYAGLFIYLNKRSYNGLYRENRSGEYNVPYREYNNCIYDIKDLRNMSEYFNTNDIQFFSQSYDTFDLDQFTSNDLIYIDPPYYPSSKSQFTAYWSIPFLVEEQKKLAQFCHKLHERGIKFIVSNSPCEEVKELYSDFNQRAFYIGRQMRSGKGKSNVFDKNTEPNEILIWNFPKLNI